MHGGINVLHADSLEKRTKKARREERMAVKKAEKEARYQTRLTAEVAAVQKRVAYMLSREAGSDSSHKENSALSVRA